MARCMIKMPDEDLLKLSRFLAKTDEIAEKVLQAGADIALPKVKLNLETAIGTGNKYDSKSTGELVSSLGISPVLQDSKGDYNIKIGFNEPRRKQYERKSKKSRNYYDITNAMIANVIEYGKHNQPPKPFIKKAKSSTKSACIKAMQTKLESELQNL